MPESQSIPSYFGCLRVIDVSAYANQDGVNPLISIRNDSKYELKWELLKRDECFYIKIVADGEINDISSVKFEVRADGINEIKTPEYRVMSEMTPILIAAALVGIPLILFVPTDITFVGIIPMRVLMPLVLLLLVLASWIMALIRRIQWLKEQ